MENQLKYVEVFTDGACKGNPGVGGWGAILIYKDNVNTSLHHIKDINGDGVCKQIQSVIPFW